MNPQVYSSIRYILRKNINKIVMKIRMLPIVALIATLNLSAQEKIPMDHSVYEMWKNLKNIQLSENGVFLLYEVNPEQGDGELIMSDLETNEEIKIPRAYGAKLSYNSKFVVGKIKPPFATTRKAKKDKIKKDMLPKDSLFIYDLSKHSIMKYENIRSFTIPKEHTNWIAFHSEYINPDEKETEEEESDGKKINEKFSKIVKQNKLADLTILNPENNKSYSYENISSYFLNETGTRLVFHQLAKDSISKSVVYSFDTKNQSLEIIFEGEGMVSKLTTDESGMQSSFLFSRDTTRISGLDLYYWRAGNSTSFQLTDSLGTGLQEGWGVNTNGKVYFSESGERLFFGSSKIPAETEKDSLLKDEKASLDVWSWHDQLLQPMQLKELKKEKKRTYLSYYSITDKRFIQLGDSVVNEISTMWKGNGNMMIGKSSDHYGKFLSWVGLRYKDIYTLNPSTGDKELVLTKLSSTARLSPFGKYILYYEREDSSWYSYNIITKQKVNLNESMAVNFYNEWNDVPQLPNSYGLIGFTENDESVLIYDRYDVWQFDPEGIREPVCLTRSYGRENSVRFRYSRLNPEEYYIDLRKKLYFTFSNEKTMEEGIAVLDMKTRAEFRILYQTENDIHSLNKAKNADVFIFRQGNFRDYADIYFCDSKFKVPKKTSNTNPQSENYLWGDVKLVHWTSFNNDKLSGKLYTPENMDPAKKYPMLVYFYERSLQSLHSHRIPSPSRSIINIPWCTSNGYVVFVPDIVYRDGYPGQSAYDAIVSGTTVMKERFKFINKDKIGIQGQSWGGYQVAYLLTQTNIYAAAMAGAPVSNMTSAYGGIRWGSGMSRMFQYEQSQSRIGGTLWEKPSLYIENSPLFYAPKVETPLLIMHNANDGAVPWYQGIEFFVALRRLDKPVWMLTYNNEKHNLTKWPNRIDLSIRMMQFFDYYLKDAPEPKWMINGVPAIEKGTLNGRKLLEQ